DKFATDFLNRKSIAINRLNNSILSKEDLLLIDQQAWEGLGAEKNIVLHAVAQGMGLVVLITETNSADNLIKTLGITSGKGYKSISPSLPTKQLQALATENLLYLRRSARQQTLVSHQKQPIATQQIYGKGKIVVTTLANTHQWLLAGHPND